MSVLRNLEARLAGLVEGTFGRVFRSEVRPVEIARKLVKEMEDHRTVSVSRTYVPNEYVVWLSPQDSERFVGMEGEIADELSAYVLEHARRQRLALVSRPQIAFRVDEQLGLGEFGIQTRTVKVGETAAEPVSQGDHGRTMVYSTADRTQDELSQMPQRPVPRRAVLAAEGKRFVVPAQGAVVGRSRECDVILADTNVSRRHAELRPTGNGWLVQDLGSTNGVRVNGRATDGPHPIADGDRVEFGTVRAIFEVES